MSEVIQLNHQSENTYEFDLEVDGLATVQMLAWFVIVGKGMEFTFQCTQKGNHFSCVIPPMPFLEKTAYKGAVRIVADDYYFEVVSDLIVNVTGNLSFERGDVKNMTVKSTVSDKKDTKDTKETKAKPVEKATVKAKDSGKDKKVSESFVDTKVQRVESPAEIAKRLMNEGTSPSTRDVPSFNALAKKSSPPVITQNSLIEEEVSEFVSAEKSAKEAKLREILKNFTVAPNATPSKARFTRKT